MTARLRIVLGTLLGAAIAAGPVVSAGRQAQAPAAAQGPDQKLDQQVDAVIARQMAARHIPGLSLGVVRGGQLVMAKGYGDATLEWKQPATPDTVYLLASMSKQFTSALIMMLVGDGKVGVDDLLSKYVDGPPSWAGITIRQLLTHTAGLRDRFELSTDGRLYLDYTTRQMFDSAARTPVDAAPGARWQYSDQGYFLLGMIIEKASGQSYAEFLKQRILTPAGMTSTTLHNWAAIVPQRADGYAVLGDRVVGSRRRYQFQLGPHYGVQSTVRDLAKYDAAISAGTLLPAAVLTSMWTPGTMGDGRPADVGGVGIGYGLGWFLEQFRGHREVYHGGSTGTCLYRLPGDALSVIVLTNLEQASGSDPCGIARQVAALHVPAIAWSAVPPITGGAAAQAAQAAKLRAAMEAFAAGTPAAADYTTEGFAQVSAAAKAQQAAFASLGAMSTFDLIADDTLAAHVVWYRAQYANATIAFRFVLDADGKIRHVQARQ